MNAELKFHPKRWAIAKQDASFKIIIQHNKTYICTMLCLPSKLSALSPADGTVRPHAQGWNGQECAAGAAHSEARLRVQEPETDGGRRGAAAGPQPWRLPAEPGSRARSPRPQSHGGSGGYRRNSRVQQREQLQHDAQIAAEAPRLHPAPQRVRRGGMGECTGGVHAVFWV